MVATGMALSFSAGGRASGQAAAGGAAAAPVTTMSVLQPAVMTLQQAIDALRVDKWRASREVKGQTGDNVGSIRRDVESTLPGLVTAADAAPESLAALLPLTRNVGALYDVVLRVTVIADSAAPGDQAEALETSLTGLEAARRTLSERQERMASAEALKVVELQKQLSARPAVAAICPPVIVAAPAKSNTTTAARRRKKAVSPAAKVPVAAAKPTGSGAK